MTPAFRTFLAEYHATGSEKADGYSRSAFIGLDASEQESVFDMLQSELPWSAQWLFLVDAERAIGVVAAEEQKLRGNSYGHAFLLQEQLVNHTGDLQYQQHMMEDFRHYIERLKPLVIDSLARTPANDATLSFFRNVILNETSASVVARAARHFLDAKSFPRVTQENEEKYRRLLRELTDGDTQAKARAIGRIDAGSGNAP